MEKIKKYNQLMLAIIGTVLMVALVLLLVFGIGALVISLFDDGIGTTNGIQLGDKLSPGDSVMVRKQQITFQDPVKLDTGKSVFLIPIGQVNLETEEKYALESGRGWTSSQYKYYSNHGLYNNFILYEYDYGQRTKIFNKKVAITNWAYINDKDVEVILFQGAGEDSNRDKLINSEDYQSLYAFFLEDKKLVEYHFENQTVLSFNSMSKTNLMAIRTGIDKNKDFKFDSYTEPQEILVLNIETRKIDHLVPEKLKAEIQDLIDH